MNIFSGARRIAAIFAAIWIICVIAYHANKSSTVQVEYRVPGFTKLWLQSESCDLKHDAIAYRDFIAPNGTEVNARFCFVAQPAKNGSLLVPYAEEGDFILLNEAYSDEVRRYTEQFVQQIFIPTAADFALAEESASSQKWFERGRSAGALFGGLLFIWLSAWCIGWVMRGFLGIPRGQDYRIAPVAVQK